MSPTTPCIGNPLVKPLFAPDPPSLEANPSDAKASTVQEGTQILQKKMTENEAPLGRPTNPLQGNKPSPIDRLKKEEAQKVRPLSPLLQLFMRSDY